MPESNAHTSAHAFAREVAVAIDAVRLAMRICRSVQQRITPDVLEKNDRSPVTVADYASQAVVCRALAATFPDDPIVGEEDPAALRQPEQSAFLAQIREHLAGVGIEARDHDVLDWIDRGGGASGARFWTLDPIDGTKGFLRCEQYAVALALIVEGRIRVGVLGCPHLPAGGGLDAARAGEGSILSAVVGGGSHVAPANAVGRIANPSDISTHGSRTIAVSDTANPGLARMCESVERLHSAHDLSARIAAELGIAVAPVRLDSQAKYAAVARGDADIYLRLPTLAGYRENIWDHAAGALIVEEAGGHVTDLDGRPLEFTHGRKLAANRGLVVTNGHLHDRVLDAARRVESRPGE